MHTYYDLPIWHALDAAPRVQALNDLARTIEALRAGFVEVQRSGLAPAVEWWARRQDGVPPYDDEHLHALFRTAARFSDWNAARGTPQPVTVAEALALLDDYGATVEAT